MHESAFKIAECFYQTYCTTESPLIILDVGSQDLNGSLREIVKKEDIYIGIDFVEAKSVDVCLDDPYKFPFHDNYADVILCSSVLEHSEFFWLTFLEMIRVLKPGGLVYINVPTNGFVHRFPVDCWRFYPDAAKGLKNWGVRNGYEVEVLESFIARNIGASIDSGWWNDYVAIFTKGSDKINLYQNKIAESFMYEPFHTTDNMSTYQNIEKSISIYRTQDLEHIDELNKHIVTYRMRVDSLENQLSDSKSELHKSVCKIDQLEEIVLRIEYENSQNNSKIIDLIAKKEESDSVIQDLIAKKEESDSIIQDLIAKKEESDSVIQDLISKKEESDSVIQDLIAKKEESDSVIQDLIAKKEESISKIRDYENQINYFKSPIWRRTFWYVKKYISTSLLTNKRFITLFNRQIKQYYHFVEDSYLKLNVDVNAALNDGRIVSGFEHFMTHGRFEGRLRSIHDLPNCSYSHWISNQESKIYSINNVQAYPLNALNVRFVIILVQKDVNFKYLKSLTDSLVSQEYSNWILHVPNELIECSENKQYFVNLSRTDQRFKIIKKDTVKAWFIREIVSDVGTNQWVIPITDKSIFSKRSLEVIAHKVQTNYSVDMIYTDEDEMDDLNTRSNHYFKPDWNREFFYTSNYINNKVIFNKKFIVSFFAKSEQDNFSDIYAIILDSLTLFEYDVQIEHLPYICFHTFRDTTSKLNISKMKLTLEKYLNKKSLDAIVSVNDGLLQVKYNLKDEPEVTVVIPSKNNYLYLSKCINSVINKTEYKNFKILVVDNGSTDDSLKEYYSVLSGIKNIKILYDHSEFNYSAINNRAVAKIESEYICFMNDDVEVLTPNWLCQMIGLAAIDDVGAVGAKLLYPNGKVQHSGIILGVSGFAGHAFKFHATSDPGYHNRNLLASEYSAVTAACMVIKRQKFIQVGGFDELNLKIACNDVDLGLKLKTIGYRNIVLPYVHFYHFESASRGFEDSPEKVKRFSQEKLHITNKWKQTIFNDPCYNINLARNAEDFSLNFTNTL